MSKITVIYTKRKWNIGSLVIRWGVPRTRFYIARASHCLVQDGDYLIEASAEHGVRRALATEALKGLTVVRVVEYEVPDAEAGLAWLRTQVGKPYDYKGAIGLAIAPDRDWTEDDMWFCFELTAATLLKAGRNSFREDAGHISGETLMAIKP